VDLLEKKDEMSISGMTFLGHMKKSKRIGFKDEFYRYRFEGPKLQQIEVPELTLQYKPFKKLQ